MWRGKRALVRLRGRGGNRVKLVSVVERERPKQCTIVFVVELGGARIRDEDRGNMSDAKQNARVSNIFTVFYYFARVR